MASITIMVGHRNLIFAAKVKEETGAEFSEDGQWITITNAPTLEIPRYCFSQAFDSDGRRAQQGDGSLMSAWRSLLRNKRGHLVSFDDCEIVISDDPPAEKRPATLLRWPDVDEKALAEEWAERMGYPSLTAYILEAIAAYNVMYGAGAI